MLLGVPGMVDAPSSDAVTTPALSTQPCKAGAMIAAKLHVADGALAWRCTALPYFCLSSTCGKRSTWRDHVLDPSRASEDSFEPSSSDFAV